MKKILSLILIAVMLISVIPMAYASGNTYSVGDTISFGSYPQTKVEDEAIIAQLNANAPAWEEWISYGYYAGTDDYGTMVQGDWMRYTDVTYNGSEYRGVKFTQYRPRYTYGEATAADQSANGYETDTVYWFAYEPLMWRVLDPATGFVICESVIDAQPYSNTIYKLNDEYYNDDEYTNFASDYYTSSIRKWLNEDFFNTAFTNSEQAKFSVTALSNEGYYTSIGTPGFESLDSTGTRDKVFLISYDEIKNTKYGFNPNEYGRDEICKVQGSDYAKIQGLKVYNSQGSDENGNSLWILRTPGINSHRCCGVYFDGYTNSLYNVYDTNYGIRPALKLINISDIDEHTHYYEAEITTPVTHIADGVKTFTCRCCGDSYTEILPKTTEHTYEAVVTLPTCSEQGYRTMMCVCGESYVTNYVSAVDHKDSDGDYLCDYGCGYEFPQPEPEEESKQSPVKTFFMSIFEWFKAIVNKILGQVKW